MDTRMSSSLAERRDAISFLLNRVGKDSMPRAPSIRVEECSLQTRILIALVDRPVQTVAQLAGRLNSTTKCVVDALTRSSPVVQELLEVQILRPESGQFRRMSLTLADAIADGELSRHPLPFLSVKTGCLQRFTTEAVEALVADLRLAGMV